eukprot:1768347-Pleurochrysis_carterae.AAC.3
MARDGVGLPPDAAAAPPAMPSAAPPPATNSDLSVFLLEAKPVLGVKSPSPKPAASTVNDTPVSVLRAWSEFISNNADATEKAAARESKALPSTRPHALPAALLRDDAVAVNYAFPASARPPPRLAAFALPSWVDGSATDVCTRDAAFCLTHQNGGHTYGFALQIVDVASGVADEPTDDEDARQLIVSSLVLLSEWPVFELHKCLLHHIFAKRSLLWPAKQPPGSPCARHAKRSSTARLTQLLRATADVLHASAAELKWLKMHPM